MSRAAAILLTALGELLVVLDNGLNVLVYIHGDGFGKADETLSARLFRCYLQGLISDRWYRLVDWVWWWEVNHCHDAWRAVFERRHMPEHYRLEPV